MTHVDPFAPADSPQHPANFGGADLYATQLPETVDVAPRWIALIGEPVAPGGDVVLDARWEEYERLLREHGSPEQVETFDVVVTADWPEEGMPTLVELREAGTPVDQPPTDAQADLEAKLAAMKAQM